MDMLKMNDVTSSRSKQLQIRCYLKTLDTMQIKRKFSSVLFLLCTLILSACSNLAVNNTNSSNIDLSKNPSDSEHKIINTYADQLISSYNVTFKNDILADNDKSMSLWEHAVYEMNFKPPKHTVNLKAVDYIKKHKKLLTQQLSNGHLFLYHIINELKMLFETVLNARSRVMLEMNVAENKFETLVKGIPSMRSPTVSQLLGGEGYAVKIAVKKADVPTLLPKLQALGAEDIVEYELRKVML